MNTTGQHSFSSHTRSNPSERARNISTASVEEPKFFEGVPEVLNTLVEGRDFQAIMESFIERLNKDWEFQFTLNYLLCDSEYNDNPFHRFMENIDDFIRKFQEGTHA